MNTIYCM